jgi:regulator of protease activity HflC (stomatin/prohibitin superfamily)
MDKKIGAVGTPPEKGFGKTITVVIIVVVGLMLLMSSVVIINPGERGVLIEMGRVTGVVYGEGLSFKTPFIQSVDVFDVKTQKLQIEASAASSDLQIVTAQIAVNYNVDPSSVAMLRRDVGMDYRSKLIDPAIQEAVKAATALFTAEELITERPVVREKIKQNLKEKLDSLSGGAIDVLEFNIVDFDFSEQFNTAIEQKVTAQQLAMKAENDLVRIRVEAEQTVASANATAMSIILQANALKEANQVLQLKWIEKWDGHLPMYLGGASNVLMTLPLSSSGANMTMG